MGGATGKGEGEGDGMKAFPERFNSDGFAFRLIWREGRVALLGKRKSEWRPEIVLWEVVLIQRVGDHTFPNGRIVPAHEAMPQPSDWGRSGWSFTADDRAGAEARFRELVAAEAAKTAERQRT
jgi:hypothetical protein